MSVARDELQPERSGRTDPLLTADEVAELLRVTRAWVYTETRARRIPHVRLGRYVRYRRSAVETWVAELEAASTGRYAPRASGACGPISEASLSAMANARERTETRSGTPSGPTDLTEREAAARSLRSARERRRRAAEPARNTAVMAKRSYGTGSLYVARDTRGREAWYGRWQAPGGGKANRMIGPKRQPGHRDGLTRVQAERELRRRMDADAVVVARGQQRTIAEAGAEYVDHLEHVMERKRTTIQDYSGYLRGHFLPFFGDRPLDRIDERAVAAYLKRKRDQGLSGKTVHNHLNFMHGLFKFAVKRGWAAQNPVATVERPKKARRPERRLRFLQPAELDALLRGTPDDTLGAVERPLYLTAAMTGLRQGELIALPWSDIDWLARRIRVADNFPRGRVDKRDSPKSHEGRSVPMADRVGAELERHFQRTHYRGDSDQVFCHPETGKPLDPSKIGKRFKKALEQAGLREITFHELRHTFGTQLAAAGVPLRTIQEWMGHGDAKTTEVYRHYAPDPTHGADMVEGAFARRSNSRSNMSETGGNPEDPKPLWHAESDPT